MRVLGLSLAAALLLAALASPVGQAAEFWETEMITDAADDYALSGVLDITGVRVSEVYRYDPVTKAGADVVEFKIDLRSRDDIRTYLGKVPIDFTLNYTVLGVPRSLNVTLTQDCPMNVPSQSNPTPGPDCSKNDPVVPAPHYTDANGITLVFDARKHFLIRGVQVKDAYVTSATVDEDGRRVFHDQAPYDNENRAEGDKITPPETKGSPVTLRGAYPFLRIAPQTPTQRYAVPGGEARFSVEFRIDEKLTGVDRIVVAFQHPPAWSVDSNLGNEIVLTEGTKTAALTFTVNVPRGWETGSQETILLDAVLPKAGGHATLRTYVAVSGPRVQVPEYGFTLLTQGPFQAGQESPLQFRITEQGAPLPPSDVRLEVLQGDKVHGTSVLKAMGNGNYETSYVFPSAGSWKLDPHIAELTPAPHRVFEVQVEGDGGQAPGATLAGLLLSLAAAFAWRRR